MREKQQPRLLSFVLRPEVQHGIEAAILGLLTLSVYLFTTNPLTAPFAVYLYIAAFAILAILFVVRVKQEKSFNNSLSSRTVKIIAFALVTGILLWVSNTGWFLSPFVYLLYLVGLSLGFLFSPSVALSFVLLLIAVLLPSIGVVNSRIDIAGIISLLMIIPLSYILRKQYIKRIAQEKKILILQEENKRYENKVDEVLANKVTHIAVDLREPLNDIQQIALYTKKHNEVEKKKDIEAILTSSRKALTLLKQFEENTTGKRLVKNKKN